MVERCRSGAEKQKRTCKGTFLQILSRAAIRYHDGHLNKFTFCENYLSHSSKHRDEHDHSHELCEEDEWSEEGPDRPQGKVKAAREG